MGLSADQRPREHWQPITKLTNMAKHWQTAGMERKKHLTSEVFSNCWFSHYPAAYNAQNESFQGWYKVIKSMSINERGNCVRYWSMKP